MFLRLSHHALLVNEIICLGAGWEIVWHSSRVDPRWLTVMLPVRQAHAMRLSSWRQINFSSELSPLTSTPSPTTNLFLFIYLVSCPSTPDSIWWPIQQTITLTFVRNLLLCVGQHTLNTSAHAINWQLSGVMAANHSFKATLHFERRSPFKFKIYIF